VAAGVVEVDAAAAVPRVDLARLVVARIGPVRHLAFDDPREDLVELGFGHQVGVVLGGDRPVGMDVVECGGLADPYDLEVAEGDGFGEAEQLGDRGGGMAVVAGGDDGVVEYGHGGRSCHGVSGRRGGAVARRPGLNTPSAVAMVRAATS
jgi:hypothetical protein